MDASLQRQPAVAGQFYPEDPRELRRVVERMLAKTVVNDRGKLIGLVSPHAGYVFSGPVAAHAYKRLENDGRFDTVVLIGPSHLEGFSFASVLTDGYYSTPLGKTPVDHELAEAIVAAGDESVQASDFGHRIIGFRGEHCLEVQLPFLQIVLPGVPIVPIIMGDPSFPAAGSLANAIINAISEDRRVVLIASSDLSHFFSLPEAEALDSVLLENVRGFRPGVLAKKFAAGETQACGGGPILAVMEASRALGANRADVLAYGTSADSPYGDDRRVVGYMAASFELVE